MKSRGPSIRNLGDTTKTYVWGARGHVYNTVTRLDVLPYNSFVCDMLGAKEAAGVPPSPDSRQLLKPWMIYALAFSIVYSLIAWPIVVHMCQKPPTNKPDIEAAKNQTPTGPKS